MASCGCASCAAAWDRAALHVDDDDAARRAEQARLVVQACSSAVSASAARATRRLFTAQQREEEHGQQQHGDEDSMAHIVLLPPSEEEALEAAYLHSGRWDVAVAAGALKALGCQDASAVRASSLMASEQPAGEPPQAAGEAAPGGHAHPPAAAWRLCVAFGDGVQGDPGATTGRGGLPRGAELYTRARRLLDAWGPLHVHAHVAPAGVLRELDAYNRAHALPAAVPQQAWNSGVRDLVHHLLGPGTAPAASGPPPPRSGIAASGSSSSSHEEAGAWGALGPGMRYLYRVRWQPDGGTQRCAEGCVELVVTDGACVWMVVAVRALRLVPRPAGSGGATSFRAGQRAAAARCERLEGARRQRRGAVARAAWRAREELLASGELGGGCGDGRAVGTAGAVCLAGMCVSLAEGLEVVGPSWRGYEGTRAARCAEEEVARCLVAPPLMLGQAGVRALAGGHVAAGAVEQAGVGGADGVGAGLPSSWALQRLVPWPGSGGGASGAAQAAAEPGAVAASGGVGAAAWRWWVQRAGRAEEAGQAPALAALSPAARAIVARAHRPLSEPAGSTAGRCDGARGGGSTARRRSRGRWGQGGRGGGRGQAGPSKAAGGRSGQLSSTATWLLLAGQLAACGWVFVEWQRHRQGRPLLTPQLASWAALQLGHWARVRSPSATAAAAARV